MCSFGGENLEEKEKKRLLHRNIKKNKREKRNGHLWAAVTHYQKYPPPPESNLKGKRSHIRWIQPHRAPLHWLLFQEPFSEGLRTTQVMGSVTWVTSCWHPAMLQEGTGYTIHAEEGGSSWPSGAAHSSLPKPGRWSHSHVCWGSKHSELSFSPQKPVSPQGRPPTFFQAISAQDETCPNYKHRALGEPPCHSRVGSFHFQTDSPRNSKSLAKQGRNEELVV